MEENFTERQLGDILVHERLHSRGSIDLYRATQTSLERTVLFKVISLRGIVETGTTSIQDFRAYISSAVTLEHLHLQPIYNAGMVDEDYLYIAGRMIAGTLFDLLAAGALPLEQTYKLAFQIASVLTYIHSRSFVHQSLSPQNIYIGDDQNVYINDLELALIVKAAPSLPTLISLLGDPFYAAAELLQLQPGDVRSETYAFGAVLYHMTTRKAPFSDGNNSAEHVLERKLNNQLIPPRQLNPALPESLERLILRSLRANPDERFPDAVSMEHELRQVALPIRGRSGLKRISAFVKLVSTRRLSS